MESLTHPPADRQRSAIEWLPLPKVARRLRMRESVVLRLIHARALPAKLVAGRRWFIRRDALDAYQRRAA